MNSFIPNQRNVWLNTLYTILTSSNHMIGNTISGNVATCLMSTTWLTAKLICTRALARIATPISCTRDKKTLHCYYGIFFLYGINTKWVSKYTRVECQCRIRVGPDRERPFLERLLGVSGHPCKSEEKTTTLENLQNKKPMPYVTQLIWEFFAKP